MNAREVHTHQLATITAAVEHARQFEHLHHLGSRASRKSAGSALHALERWQSTVDSSVRHTAMLRQAVVEAPTQQQESATVQAPELNPSAQGARSEHHTTQQPQ